MQAGDLFFYNEKDKKNYKFISPPSTSQRAYVYQFFLEFAEVGSQVATLPEYAIRYDEQKTIIPNREKGFKVKKKLLNEFFNSNKHPLLN